MSDLPDIGINPKLPNAKWAKAYFLGDLLVEAKTFDEVADSLHIGAASMAELKGAGCVIEEVNDEEGYILISTTSKMIADKYEFDPIENFLCEDCKNEENTDGQGI